MAVVYIEPRPKGRPSKTLIKHYAVETGASQRLAIFKSQHTAIDWAKDHGYGICVARGRAADKSNPDHWRKA
jgi:hypothetical protein